MFDQQPYQNISTIPAATMWRKSRRVFRVLYFGTIGEESQLKKCHRTGKL